MMTTKSTGPTRTPRLLRWRTGIMLLFAMQGFSMASWVAAIPAVRDGLGASTGAVAALVATYAAGSMLGILAAERLLRRFGPRVTITGGVVGMAGAVAALGCAVQLLQSFPAASAALLLLGGSTGVCNVNVNVDGAANERALGVSTLPRLHACYSIGMVLGAGIGALALAAGRPIGVILAVAGVLVFLVGLTGSRLLPAGWRAVQGARADGSPARRRSGRREWLDLRTVLIAVFAVGMTFAEGSANDWLSLAVVRGHGLQNATGAAMFGLFAACMLAGRALGHRATERFGRVAVLRVSAVLVVIGLVLVIVAPDAGVIAVGAVCWGLGASLGYPLSISAASDHGEHAAMRVTLIASAGTVACLTGPMLIGLLAARTGLLDSLLVVVAMVVPAVLLAPALRRPPAAALAC